MGISGFLVVVDQIYLARGDRNLSTIAEGTSRSLRTSFKLSQNVLCEEFLDFPMARHRLRNARLLVPIPVVFPAVPD
jgi:hypothetical protein